MKKLSEIDREILSLYPNKIDTKNPNFLSIDNKFVSSIMVTNYNKEMEETFLDRILSLEINLDLSMFYEKQNTSEIVKKLTYHIGNTGADLKTSNENQSDSEVMSTTYSDAKYIRKKLQIDGEDCYYLYIYISVYSNSREKLEADLQKLESVAAGIGLRTRRAIFRQLDIFEATLPILTAPAV